MSFKSTFHWHYKRFWKIGPTFHWSPHGAERIVQDGVLSNRITLFKFFFQKWPCHQDWRILHFGYILVRVSKLLSTIGHVPSGRFFNFNKTKNHEFYCVAPKKCIFHVCLCNFLFSPLLATLTDGLMLVMAVIVILEFSNINVTYFKGFLLLREEDEGYGRKGKYVWSMNSAVDSQPPMCVCVCMCVSACCRHPSFLPFGIHIFLGNLVWLSGIVMVLLRLHILQTYVRTIININKRATAPSYPFS